MSSPNLTLKSPCKPSTSTSPTPSLASSSPTRLEYDREPRNFTISDEGRVPLGNLNSENRRELQELIVNSVLEETLKAWNDFEESTRKKPRDAFMAQCVDKDVRTYPAKRKNEYLVEEGSQPSTSYVPEHRFKINRKVEQTAETLKITIPDRNSEQSVSEMSAEERSRIIKEKTLLNLSILQQRRKARVEEVLGENSAVEEGLNTPRQKCILYKFGHCIRAEKCPYSHSGDVEQKVGAISSIRVKDWPKRTSDVEICPGYLNMVCWDMECNLRHVALPRETENF